MAPVGVAVGVRAPCRWQPLRQKSLHGVPQQPPHALGLTDQAPLPVAFARKLVITRCLFATGASGRFRRVLCYIEGMSLCNVFYFWFFISVRGG
jgi:hypothetical protein